jgi:ribose 5-phosphate isomerase B
MTILFSSDHAGYDLKCALVPFVQELGFTVEDLGPNQKNDTDDYPDWIGKAAARVSKQPNEYKAIVIGGSGQGEAIVANRYPQVRAVVFNGPTATHTTDDGAYDEIILSREHNDANILSLGARFLSIEEAQEVVRRWLTTDFSNDERHARRIAKIEQHPASDTQW